MLPVSVDLITLYIVMSRGARYNFLLEVLGAASRVLDKHIYEPLLSQRIGPAEEAIVSSVGASTYYQNLDRRLRYIKLGSLYFSAAMAGAAMIKIFHGKSTAAIIYGTLMMDLLRISFNANTKHYIVLLVRKYGDISYLSSSIMQWTQAAFSTRVSDDPLAHLANDVQTEILLSGTVIQKFLRSFFI